MKKSIILVALLCITLLTSCSAPNLKANETQAEPKTAALNSESSVDNTSSESDLPLAPYKSYQLDSSIEDVLNNNPIDKSFYQKNQSILLQLIKLNFLENIFKYGIQS